MASDAFLHWCVEPAPRPRDGARGCGRLTLVFPRALLKAAERRAGEVGRAELGPRGPAAAEEVREG